MMTGRRSHEQRPPRRCSFSVEAALRLRRSHRGPASATRRRLAVVARFRDSTAPRSCGLCSRLDAASPSLPHAPARDSTAPRRRGPRSRPDAASPSLPRAPASTFLPRPQLGLIDSMGIEMIWVRSRLFIGG
jgi:hypothetical protein